MITITEQQVKELFQTVGFEIKKIYRLENKYWPNNGNFNDLRIQNPWFLVKTQFGFIEIGPRKRVIHLEWSETSYRGKLPVSEGEEWITSEDHYVHSYTLDKFLMNLIRLYGVLKEKGVLS